MSRRIPNATGVAEPRIHTKDTKILLYAILHDREQLIRGHIF